MSEERNSAVRLYGNMAHAKQVTIDLTKSESCSVLKIYDDGLAGLTKQDIEALNSILAKLKDQIWP